MKRIVLFLLCYVTVLSAFANRHALLIGVGQYPVTSGWISLSSVNDILFIKQKLSPAFDVQMLTDEQATHHNIIVALKRLIATADKGDTLLVHFSCHGQQMLTEGKEEPDYLDEALVPYDAALKASASYHGECHLTDNEFGTLVAAMRGKVGPNGLVIVTIDACFSDSMNKGEEKQTAVVRGTKDIFGSNLISRDSLQKVFHHRKAIDTQNSIKHAGFSDVVFFSACKSYQKDQEIIIGGKSYGPLSYAMASAFGKVDIDHLSEWLDAVYNIMIEKAYTQSPQIRTTLSYHFPETPAALVSAPVAKKGDSMRLHLLLGLLAISLLTVILVIWKKRKKS